MNEVAQIMQVVGLPNQSQFILEQINDKHVGDLVNLFQKRLLSERTVYEMSWIGPHDSPFF